MYYWNTIQFNSIQFNLHYLLLLHFVPLPGYPYPYTTFPRLVLLNCNSSLVLLLSCHLYLLAPLSLPLPLPLPPFQLSLPDSFTQCSLPYPRPPSIDRVVATCSGLTKSDSSKLWAVINFYGGKCQAKLNANVTHLITAATSGENLSPTVAKNVALGSCLR